MTSNQAYHMHCTSGPKRYHLTFPLNNLEEDAMHARQAAKFAVVLKSGIDEGVFKSVMIEVLHREGGIEHWSYGEDTSNRPDALDYAGILKKKDILLMDIETRAPQDDIICEFSKNLQGILNEGYFSKNKKPFKVRFSLLHKN